MTGELRLHDPRIAELLFRSATGSLTDDERRELDEWCGDDPERRALCARMADSSHVESEYLRRRMMAAGVERPLADMERRIRREGGSVSGSAGRRRLYIASAAAALFITLLAAWTLSMRRDVPQPEGDSLRLQALADIRPGTAMATLITPEGENVALSASDDGSAATAIAARHTPSATAAATSGEEPAEERRLCLDVPRGGEFRIILEDSTQVWLNSESRLTYPESFTGSERRVSVEGEAYFAVAHDERPFYVETAGQLVRVYGTEFNIRSYDEDSDVRTTLVSGSISLSRMDDRSSELMLSPGHQAMFSKAGESMSVRPVDTDVVTGWRHGRFVFEGQSLEQIMRDLSRWYSFDYDFADEQLRSIIFMGSIPRYAEFGTALAILEKSGGLQFGIEGMRVVVSRRP